VYGSKAGCPGGQGGDACIVITWHSDVVNLMCVRLIFRMLVRAEVIDGEVGGGKVY
jgi:hypothetical protein